MPSIKTFVFKDKRAGKVIFSKKSRCYDYDFSLPDVESLVMTEDISFPADADHPLRKKLEALIFLRTTEGMMIEQIEKTLSIPSNIANYQRLVAIEKRLALDRVQKFFAEKHAQIVACKTPEDVTKFMKDMSDRVNLGVYSVMNQERKGLDGHIARVEDPLSIPLEVISANSLVRQLANLADERDHGEPNKVL